MSALNNEIMAFILRTSYSNVGLGYNIIQFINRLFSHFFMIGKMLEKGWKTTSSP